MYQVRRLVIFFCFFAVTIPLLAWALPKFLNPTPPTKEDRQRDAAWVSSSPYWLDRQACRWLTLCGLHHVHKDYASLNEEEELNELWSKSHIELRRSLEWSTSTNKEKRHTDQPQQQARSEAPTRRKTQRNREENKNKQEDDNLKPIPQYVLDNAPLVHLYSGENFWPSDIAEHVRHMAPVGEGGELLNMTEPLTLHNLDQLNDFPLHNIVYLESTEDVEERPEWLHSRFNLPNAFPKDSDGDDNDRRDSFFTDPAADEWSWFDVDHDHPLHGISDPRRLDDVGTDDGRAPRGSSRRRKRSEQAPLTPGSPPSTKPDTGGYSSAPAVLILVRKGPHILDAFWFFFYSYNLGQTVTGIRFGNHVGDWEHCMVRFEDGIPRAVFMSEHAGGQAYAWDAVEKRKMNVTDPTTNESRDVERFVLYSAVGSHAMYANPGDHPYIIPFNLLRDQTDRGPIWDPSLNTYAYHYDYRAGLKDSFGPEPDEEIHEAMVPPAVYPFHHHDENATESVGKRGLGAETEDEEFPGDRGLEPAASNPDAPTGWFHFLGPWGDETYGLDDMRQYRLFGQYHYLTGPLGPKLKYLERHKVCQTERCKVLHRIKAGSTWY